MSALVKPLTWILGIVFVLIGVLGFFMDPILGLFDVNPLHNVVHLASGAVALIAASMSHSASRMYLIVFGLVYLLVAIAGFMNIAAVVSLLELNQGDNILHVLIAAACLLVGFSSKS